MQADEPATVVPPTSLERFRHKTGYRRQRLEISIANGVEQALGLSKWLTTSLFALNGAGVLFSMNAAAQLDLAIVPAGLFTAGLLGAMASGWVNQNAAMSSIDPAEALVRIWNEAEFDGDFDADDEAKQLAELESINEKLWKGPILGWVSLAFFIAGSAVLGFDVARPNARTTQICEPLQRDMLAAKPKRPDSRELFEALGCATR